MNKYELSYVKTHIYNTLCSLRNFFDSTNTVNLSVTRKNLVTKVFAQKCTHHAEKTLLFIPCVADKIEMLNFCAALLCSIDKQVIFADTQYFCEYDALLNFLNSHDSLTVVVQEDKISATSNQEEVLLFTTIGMNLASVHCLCRSCFLLLASAGKNVTNNIDCFSLNEYGISGITNGLKITDITDEEHTDVSEKMF